MGHASLLAALLVSGPAPQTLAVSISVNGKSAAVSVEEVERVVLELATFVPGLNVLPPERKQIFSSALAKCGSDVACVADVARKAGVDRVLMIVLEAGVEPIIGSMQLVDAASGQLAGSSVVELDPSPAPIARPIRGAASEVFDATGLTLGGRVTLAVTPLEAIVETTLDRVGPATFLGPVGVHTIHVSAPGHSDLEQSVELVRGTEIGLSLELQSSSLFTSPWTWVVIGGVVVAGAVTSAVLLSRNDGCVCFGRPEDCGACP